jgi:hypothetical protein
MAINATRSMNGDLQMGIKDGRFKSITPDRGGEVETEQVIDRAVVLPPQYNVTDATYQIGDPKYDGHGYNS